MSHLIVCLPVRGLRVSHFFQIACVLAVAALPSLVIAQPSGRLAVALTDKSQVAFVAADGSRLATVSTDPGPKAMALHQGTLWVANRGVGTKAGSTISLIDPQKMALTRSVRICASCAPRGLAFDGENRLWVSGQAHRSAYWMEPPFRQTAGSILTSWGWPADVARIGDRLVIGFRDTGNLAVLDTVKLVSGRVAVGLAPSSVAGNAAATVAWAGSKDGGPLLRLTDGGSDVQIQPVYPDVAVLDLAMTASGDAVAAVTKAAELVFFEQSSAKVIGKIGLGALATQVAFDPTGAFAAASIPTERKVVLVSVGSEPAIVGSLSMEGFVGDLVWLP